MAKVGLKDTLALLAKGYSKKEIDALAAVDEEQKEEAPAPAPVPEEEKKEEQKEEEKKEEQKEEPDYKAMYEELLKEKEQELNEKNETIKKIQKENINSNSLPDVEKLREEEHASLIDAIRSFY